MDKNRMIEIAEYTLEAWNRQDVELVVGCYTPDLVYRDPNTHGEIRGAEGMGRYLTKLFAMWTMNWKLREAQPFSECEGGAFLWRASLRRAGSDKAVEVDGMDLVIMENELIKRNEVYFDRAALASIL